MSAVDDLPPLREVIRQHGLRAKKSLGQNFLLDLNLTARIARAAGPLEDVDVIEIGPGPGGLTRALLAAGARRVIAIERDERAVAALEQIARRYPGRLKIVAGDALDLDPRPLVDSASARIVANLPYNIATALLVGWLTQEPWPPWYDRLVLMFQREVAERLVATPGSKSYGRLSVLVGWRCKARICFDVAASACSRRRGSRRPPGPRISRSRVSSPWRGPSLRADALLALFACHQRYGGMYAGASATLWIARDHSCACSWRTKSDSPVCRSRLSRSAARIVCTSANARSISVLITT